jgi:hypothetical protein
MCFAVIHSVMLIKRSLHDILRSCRHKVIQKTKIEGEIVFQTFLSYGFRTSPKFLDKRLQSDYIL